MQSKRTLITLIFAFSLITIWIVGCNGAAPTVESPPEPATSLTDSGADQPPQVDADVPEPANTPEIEAGVQDPEITADIQELSINAFFEESFQALMMRSPETVLSVGLTDVYNVTEVALDNISDNYQRETYALMADTLQVLETYDRASLSPEEQISYDVYQWYLEDQLASQEFMYHDYPATYFPPTSVPEDILLFFTDIHPVRSMQDAQDYVTRLSLVDTKIDQLVEGLGLSAEAGVTPPEFGIQWLTYGSMSQLVSKPARGTPLYTGFKEKVDALSDGTPEEKQALLDEAEVIIADEVLPAYQDLRQHLNQLEVYSGKDSGVWRLPRGADYYAYLLRHFTTTNLSAEEIHQLGLDELERIHAEMKMVFEQLGYPQGESLVAYYDRVGVDGGHVSGNDVLATYEALISEADQNLDAAFDIRPEAEVVVIGDQFGGFYISGSIDGSRPGAFYAAVGGAGEPYYAMPTLAYHEAIPGHHFQISLALEMRDLPSFRQGLTFTAYTEGWALYAEYLAQELGWYADDPYGHLGHLQAKAFRAARLVVDTGLHAHGWTFDQAQKFFTENTGLEVNDPINPEFQIARYLVWPAQATSYYIGYLKLMELREHAMTELGDQFDLKEFHRIVLSNGAMPLEILETVVEDYVEEKSQP
jgi:uncharacterized protein (DUF885 family)